MYCPDVRSAQNMLWIQNFNVKEYKMEECQKLIKENEKTLAKHAPKGWKYIGTYCYVLGFGPYCGAFLWECSNYADFDVWRNHDDPTSLILRNRSWLIVLLNLHLLSYYERLEIQKYLNQRRNHM